MPEIRVDLAPGQEPLLDAPPCDCDRDIVNVITEMATLIGVKGTGSLDCPIGPATALALAAASLVNPANVKPEYSDDVRRAARIVAETMEKIAKGIRMRASE